MEFKYRLDLNLKQFASVQVGINFLEQPTFNDKIEQYLKHFTKEHYESIVENYYEAEEHQRSLIRHTKEWLEELFHQVESMTHIPEFIKREIIYMIPRLADRKVAWLDDQYRRMLLDSFPFEYPNLGFYCHNLRWTSIGTIDGVKIFEHLYDQYVKEDRDVDMIYLFDEACSYCLKDYIMKIWNNFTEDNRKMNIHTNDFSEIIGYWRCCLLGESEFDYRQRIISNGNFKYPNITSFDYFLNLEIEGLIRGEGIFLYPTDSEDEEKYTSDEDEKIRRKVDKMMVQRAGRLMLNDLYLHQYFDECISRIKFIDMLVLLFQRMSKPSKENLIKKYSRGTQTNLLGFWPWQTMMIPISEGRSENSTFQIYHELFTSILQIEKRYMSREIDFKSDSEEHQEQKSSTEIKPFDDFCVLRLPCKLWDATPIRIKQIYVPRVCLSIILEGLSPWKQIPFLAYILNDEDVQPVRDKIFGDCSRYCSDLLEVENYEAVNCFVEYVLRDDAERAKVRKGIDVFRILQTFFNRSSSVHRIEKVLSWILRSEDESITFKKSLTSAKCLQLISIVLEGKDAEFRKDGLPWFLKFLNYSEDELIELKNHLKGDMHFIQTLRELDAEHHPTNPEILLSCDLFSSEEMTQLFS